MPLATPAIFLFFRLFVRRLRPSRRADVDREVLRPSDHVTTCPYKGEASYYSIAVGSVVHPDAVWRYATPHDAVAEIADTVAFDTRYATIEVADAD